MNGPLYDAIDGEELKIVVIDEVVKALNNCGFLTRGLAFPILHKCQVRIHLEIAEDLIPIREAIHERTPKAIPEGAKLTVQELTVALPEQIGEVVAPDQVRTDHQIPLPSTRPATLLTIDERVQVIKGWLKERQVVIPAEPETTPQPPAKATLENASGAPRIEG